MFTADRSTAQRPTHRWSNYRSIGGKWQNVPHEALLDDGSDRRMLTEAQLDASISKANASCDSAADCGADQEILHNTPLCNRPTDRLP